MLDRKVRKKDGRVNMARVTPRLNLNKVDKEGMREISVKQLSLLMYHFYIMLDDPTLCGFNDSEKTASQFQAELNQRVKISTESLERLLYYLEIAYENQLYWNPAEEDFEHFVKGLLEKKEQFDRLTCLIMDKKI